MEHCARAMPRHEPGRRRAQTARFLEIERVQEQEPAERGERERRPNEPPYVEHPPKHNAAIAIGSTHQWIFFRGRLKA